MNVTEIDSELFKILAKRRNRPSVSSEDRLREDLAIDSIAFVRLVIDIERTFSVRFGDEMLTVQIFEKVDDLSRYIKTLVAENGCDADAPK